MESIKDFMKGWPGKKAMVPISINYINDVEQALDIVLPRSYKYLLEAYGLLRTANVFTATIDLSVDINEVQDFLSLDDVVSLSKLYELTGMPKGHILFASDSKGNMFCFKQDECIAGKNDISVWLYQRDDCSVKKVADTFSDWLNLLS